MCQNSIEMLISDPVQTCLGIISERCGTNPETRGLFYYCSLFIYLLFVFIFLQEYFFFICVVTKSRLNPKGSAFEWGVKTPLGEIQYRYSIEVLPNVLNSKPTSKAARAAGSIDTTHQLFTDCQR